MDYKTLSAILGHYSVAFTMDTYVHSTDEHKRPNGQDGRYVRGAVQHLRREPALSCALYTLGRTAAPPMFLTSPKLPHKPPRWKPPCWKSSSKSKKPCASTKNRPFPPNRNKIVVPQNSVLVLVKAELTAQTDPIFTPPTPQNLSKCRRAHHGGGDTCFAETGDVGTGDGVALHAVLFGSGGSGLIDVDHEYLCRRSSTSLRVQDRRRLFWLISKAGGSNAASVGCLSQGKTGCRSAAGKRWHQGVESMLAPSATSSSHWQPEPWHRPTANSFWVAQGRAMSQGTVQMPRLPSTYLAVGDIPGRS